MEPDAPPPADVDSRRAELFETLATTAEAIAETEDKSAEVHDSVAAHLPGASEHAARARRLADAERAAAAAYRRHENPPEDVRRAIRQVRPGADDEIPPVEGTP